MGMTPPLRKVEDGPAMKSMKALEGKRVYVYSEPFRQDSFLRFYQSIPSVV